MAICRCVTSPKPATASSSVNNANADQHKLKCSGPTLIPEEIAVRHSLSLLHKVYSRNLGGLGACSHTHPVTVLRWHCRCRLSATRRAKGSSLKQENALPVTQTLALGKYIPPFSVMVGLP